MSLAAIIVGSELLVTGSKTIIARVGLTETFFGMIVLALLMSIEELARELPAALKGRPDITYGNVVGSILAFFCFNAGIIALVRPVEVPEIVLSFYLPASALAILATTLFMLARKVPRWAGVMLIVLYFVFAVGGYFATGLQIAS